MDNPDFQNWWYRMVYMLRCFSKPGVVPAGLWAFQPTDAPAWHGDYHHNYNAWQPYWTAFIINHPAQAEPWVDYMNAMLPRLKWFAKETYDCEGAFVGISSFAFEPDPAQCRSKNQRQIGLMRRRRHRHQAHLRPRARLRLGQCRLQDLSFFPLDLR